MKKSLIFVGMLSIGFAYAQRGNVGINSNKPKATLDIQPNADNARVNATTNQGILAPRLSKVRVANIETPVEGTLVYVTDETTSPISAYTGADNKVAKITEKGYYFYNGTEWVKAGADATSQIWQKQADKSILLVDKNIEKNIKYNSNGGYFNYPKEMSSFDIFYDYNLNNSQLISLNNIKSRDFIYNTTKGLDYVNSSFNEKSFSPQIDILLIDELKDIDNNTVVQKKDNKTILSDKINSNIKYIRNNVFTSENRSNHNIASTANVVARNLELGNGNVGNSLSIEGTNRIKKEMGEIRSSIGGIFNNSILKDNKAKIIDVFSIFAKNEFRGTSNVKNRYGIFVENIIEPSMNVENSYDFYVRDINSKATNSYGIYIPGDYKTNFFEGNLGIGINKPTEKLEVDGKIKTSSLAQTGAGDRVVYADENGVLKTGVSAAANVKLATTNNVECTEANTGTMNFGSINIEGKATEAFGFCMKNSEGEYQWYYIYGGAGITTGQGAFGQGLQ